jgi:hypothetical protein
MSTVPKLSLHGILPAQALLGQLDSGALAPGMDRSSLLAQWQKSNQAFRELGNPARSFVQDADLAPVPDGVAEDVTREIRRAVHYSPFDSHPPRAVVVPIGKIVTPQLSINLERVRRHGEISREASIEDLSRYMFHSLASGPEISRQVLGMAPTGGALFFTTYDEDVRLHQPPIFRTQPINDRDPSAQQYETVCFPIGGGTPFPYAMRIPIAPRVSRLVLANGAHRTAAAALAGVSRIPLLVCDFQPVEFPDLLVDMPRQLLLDPTFNAPTIADFANKSVTIELEFCRQLRAVRLNWSFESYLLSLR